MSAPSASLPFDARALTEQVDRATVRSSVRQLKASGRMPSTSSAATIVGIVIGAVFLVIFGSTFIGILSAFFALGSSSDAPVLFRLIPVAMLVIFALGVGLGIWAIVRSAGTRGGRAYRLDRFARANGMTWYPEAPNPPLPGMIFSLGHSRLSTDILRGTVPRLVEFANYRYKTGSGKDETTSSWGYVAVKLAHPLPHIVLDAVGNNSVFGSNLPASFDRHQRLSLEGDFDRSFALYCPQGYERDALYLFTPDIMARFVDHAAMLDVEIVDDWLFLYTRRETSTLDPATWAWLFSIVGALLDKLGQWERWRDDRVTGAAVVPGPSPVPERVEGSSLPFVAPASAAPPAPPPSVAPQGRRLKRSVPWVAVVFVVVFLAAWLMGPLGVIAGLIGSMFGR